MGENNPYAIIQTGGKQYRVFAGDVIDIELLESQEEGNSSITFNEILFLHDGEKGVCGTPTVKGLVKGELLDHVRGPKVISYKYKRRKNLRRKIGHRQNYMRVKITEIGV